MKDITEDAPTNAAGSGAVASIGVGEQGEPPGKKKTKLVKRQMSFREFLKQ